MYTVLSFYLTLYDYHVKKKITINMKNPRFFLGITNFQQFACAVFVFGRPGFKCLKFFFVEINNCNLSIFI